jgi:lycopene beta-cyclase
MERWHYALVLAACVAVTLPLELGLGARVYRRPWLVVRALLPVMAVFVIWDLVAYSRGVWWFDDGHILGPRLLGLPAEEWLFFVVVPLCVLLTYEAVGNVLRYGWRGAARRAPVRRPSARAEVSHG